MPWQTKDPEPQKPKLECLKEINDLLAILRGILVKSLHSYYTVYTSHLGSPQFTVIVDKSRCFMIFSDPSAAQIHTLMKLQSTRLYASLSREQQATEKNQTIIAYQTHGIIKLSSLTIGHKKNIECLMSH